MNIRKEASAGAAESADVLISVRPADVLNIQIASTVSAQFGHEIEKTIREVLKNTDVKTGEIIVDDRGALDWVLRARLEAAIDRGKGDRT